MIIVVYLMFMVEEGVVELLVQELISLLKDNFEVELKEINVTTEDVHFSLPRALSA